MEFDFTDTGTGPALLFLPGSYSSQAAWKGVQKALQGSYRLISTSLPGYGATPEVRGDDVRDTDLMTSFVAQVVRHIGEPVHLVGHSWGGLVAFAATLGGKIAPLSLITFEANPVFSRPSEGAFPWLKGVLDANERFDAAHAAGDPDAAGIIIDYWSEPGFFRSMPEQVRGYCRSTASTNILDWRCAAGFTPVITEYAAIEMPCTVVRGAFANEAITDISDAISDVLPQGSLRVVDGAGHFLISTHAAECAALIDAHMAQVL